jgi:hypothetical protein
MAVSRELLDGGSHALQRCDPPTEIRGRASD